MQPIVLQGDRALSEFRTQALLQKLAPWHITFIETRQVFFIETGAPLPKPVQDKAYELLAARDEFRGTDGLFVTPRKGTISPWSSKATDIFHNCGLHQVKRVEHGIHYRLLKADGTCLSLRDARPVFPFIYDRMTEGLYADIADLFAHQEPAPLVMVDILSGGEAALQKANVDLGLALNDDEISYLCAAYQAIKRNPTDVELVMFGQVNSEHCRHKIFNAEWTIDGKKQEHSLFGMIKHTHRTHPGNTLVAYADNAGIIRGFADAWFAPQGGSHVYTAVPHQIDIIMKVETHNHPTAISPYPGAATGTGGEIRDESATGTSGKSKAGLCGFMVSNLRIPEYLLPWEKEIAAHPRRLATPLEIMIDGPLGAAQFGNEYGRPQLTGFFRTYEELVGSRNRGYHKPIMLAGGMGNIKRLHAYKQPIPPGALILQLGGPAMRIGLGGGAASSMATGSNLEDLDFNSVQRDNAEMQRRCQEVIDACIALDDRNPILSIHDIGAGGLSNGCPELVSETGGKFFLRKINSEERSLSPMEIWCNESQERYVLAIQPESRELLLDLCRRERCLVAMLGEATADGHLSLYDDHFKNYPIDMDLKVLLGKPPRMQRNVTHQPQQLPALDLTGVTLADAAQRVLQLPTVANKTFLITIADRSITGLVARDQMTGPFQVPIADQAVTATSLRSFTGETMCIGERTPLALISPAASGRMAIGEALTNMAATYIGKLENVKLSANWMCACGEAGEDAGLFDTVRAVGLELCPRLGIAVPVGKDSLSMRTVWESSDGKKQKQTAPLSLIVSAFSSVEDVRLTVTADIKPAPSHLLLVDLGAGRNRLGGSALAQCYNQVGAECPDLDDPALMIKFFAAMQELVKNNLLLAYHDRSDGGLFTTLAEMAFGGRTGLSITIDDLGPDPLAALFNEELGVVVQVHENNLAQVQETLQQHGLAAVTKVLGTPTNDLRLTVRQGRQSVFCESIPVLQQTWSRLTYHMQKRRDNPACAQEEFDNILDAKNPGMQFKLTFDPAAPFNVNTGVRPRMAILREQGINGQIEMAAAFDRAGFESVDVHMTDLIEQRVNLKDFAGLVACGGFSYGDVLGAGSGWAKSVLFNEELKEMFAAFFARPDTFALGVCNGCQMMAQLKGIIPGAAHWPLFTRNRSERFEARFVTVEIIDSPSIFFKDMSGSRLGIPVAHGEGFANFAVTGSREDALAQNLVAARYVDNYGAPTERYPFNPNGSPQGITGLTTIDGRVTIMMPHPERAFRAIQLSYKPTGLFKGDAGPWLRMFQNARKFVA
jgi:phosphoribosylformylglycinamidine synthase